MRRVAVGDPVAHGAVMALPQRPEGGLRHHFIALEVVCARCSRAPAHIWRTAEGPVVAARVAETERAVYERLFPNDPAPELDGVRHHGDVRFEFLATIEEPIAAYCCRRHLLDPAWLRSELSQRTAAKRRRDRRVVVGERAQRTVR
jgi:hypothetical protein